MGRVERVGVHWTREMDELLIKEAAAGLGWARRAARYLTAAEGRRVTWQMCEDRAQELALRPSVAPPDGGLNDPRHLAAVATPGIGPLAPGFMHTDGVTLFTLRTPLPPKALSPNDRRDRRGKDGKAAYVEAARGEARTLCANLMQLEGIDPPRWKVASVLVICRFRSERLRWDADNVAAAGKAYLDGLADAGLLAEDRYVADYAGRSLVDARNVGMAIYVWNQDRLVVQPPVAGPTPLRPVPFTVNFTQLAPVSGVAW